MSGQLGGVTIARRRLPGGQVRSESLAGLFVSGPDAFIGKGWQAEDLTPVKTNESRLDEILRAHDHGPGNHAFRHLAARPHLRVGRAGQNGLKAHAGILGLAGRIL